MFCLRAEKDCNHAEDKDRITKALRKLQEGKKMQCRSVKTSGVFCAGVITEIEGGEQVDVFN